MLVGSIPGVGKVTKVIPNPAREAAKRYFREITEGLNIRTIRSYPDANGVRWLKGAGSGPGGPTYRPKLDGTYSVGPPGAVKHFRPDGKGGYTIDVRP